MEHSRYAYANIVLRQVGHDLKSPLTAIIGTLEAILTLGDRLSATQRETLCKTGIKEAYRLQHFIQNILALSRMENDGIDITKTTLRLRDVIASLQQKMGQQHQNVTITTGGLDEIDVHADQKWLDEALWQVFDNVGRHNPAAQVTCTVSAARIDSGVTLTITDNGIGIPADIRNTLFDKHVKGPATAQQDASAGVGLTIARMIIAAHNGTITLGDAATGASFIIVLPD